MSDPLVQIPFAGGPDESTDPRQLPPGSFIACLNAQYDQDGAIGVRYGYTMFPNPPSSVFRAAVFGFELLLFTLVGGCTSFSFSEGAFVQRDAAANVGVTHAPLSNSTSTYNGWGLVDVSGYRVVGWIDAVDNFPRVGVYDQQTGALVLTKQLSSQVSTTMHVGAVGTTAIVVVADGGVANIRAYTLQTSPLGAWSAGVLISDVNYVSSAGLYTAAFGSNIFAIAYEQQNAGSSLLRVIGYNAALTQQYSVGNTYPGGTNALFGFGSRLTVGEMYTVIVYAQNIAGGNHMVGMAINPATGVKLTTYNLGFDTAGPSGAQQIGIDRITASVQTVTVSDGLNTWSLQVNSGGVVAASTIEAFNVRSVTAPVFIASLGTAVAIWSDVAQSRGGPAQGSYFLVDLVTGTPGTYPSFLQLLTPTLASLNAQPTVGLSFPAGQWGVSTTGQLENVLPVVRTTAGRQGLETFTLDATPAANYRLMGAVLGKEAYFSGLRYDSRLLVEHGFPQLPNFTAANNAGAGSVFQYAVTWGWIDNQGNLEESGIITPVPVTSGATPNVTLTIKTTGMTRKQRVPADPMVGKVAVIVYRTPALASGDTTFYRLNLEPFTFFNNPTLATLTFTDTASDASITDGTHPVLYTVSGELNHNAPEALGPIVAHKNRIWGIGADQRTIWYSQQYVDSVIPAWNNNFQMTVDDAGEPLLALASLYDKLLIFTRSKIFVLYGDGPAINGSGNDLQAPQRVPSPAGCIDPRSIVNTPLGVMFQSQRGIELVASDLSVAFLGQPVSVTTATYPLCTSANLVEVRSVVRFTFTNSEAYPNSGNGVIVQYDLRRSRWAVHKMTCGGVRGNVAGAPMQTAAVHPTHGYFAAHNDNTTAALVYIEDPSTYLDLLSFFVPLSVTTAWIKSGDLQGWQSVRRVLALLNYGDAHGLSVNFAYDYQGFVEAAHVYTDTQIGNLRNGSYEQVLLVPGAGRHCEAIQMQMTTVAPTVNPVGTGQGGGFIGLAFEVHRAQGKFRRVPAAGVT